MSDEPGEWMSDESISDEAQADRPQRRGLSIATQLVQLAQERYSFGVTTDGEPYALPVNGGHIVTMLREGKSGLRAELAREFFRLNQRAPTSSAITDALAVLDGMALEMEPADVHLRTAGHDDAVYIDVGDSLHHIVRVGADGWSIMTGDVPVLFRRTKLTVRYPFLIAAATSMKCGQCSTSQRMTEFWCWASWLRR